MVIGVEFNEGGIEEKSYGDGTLENKKLPNSLDVKRLQVHHKTIKNREKKLKRSKRQQTRIEKLRTKAPTRPKAKGCQKRKKTAGGKI